MNSVQESKNELEAAIRYAENAISAAQSTIESMQFRQDMAKKEYEERTGREQALEREVSRLKDINKQRQSMIDEAKEDKEILILENTKLKLEQKDLNFDNTQLQEANDHLEACVAELKAELEQTKSLEDQLKGQVLTATMPVIPRDVAIAIFREGIATGVLAACSELEGQSINIDENEYCGDFSVSFEREISLDEYVDFDWMRDKAGDYTEDAVIDSLKGLCADNKFECRIHGIDDNE